MCVCIRICVFSGPMDNIHIDPDQKTERAATVIMYCSDLPEDGGGQVRVCVSVSVCV
jgi:hypothetical protein